MEIVILLVPLAFLLLALGIWAFVWAMRGGQFDDLESPKYRILFDDQEQRRFDDEPGRSQRPASPPEDAQEDDR